ncbi:MAG: hypothetical protein ACI4U2_05735 [Christensenellaceae bacterium]
MSEPFEYTYHAPTEAEREEIESIRREYLPSGSDQLAELKKLDRRVRRGPKTLAVVLAVAGTLVFGGGLSLVLEMERYAVGSLVALVGIGIVLTVAPIYRTVLERNRKKYADRIVKLSDELLKKQ